MKVKLLDLQAKFTSDVTTIKLELTPDELAKLTLADGEAVYKPADKETRPWRKNTCTDCPCTRKRYVHCMRSYTSCMGRKL